MVIWGAPIILDNPSMAFTSTQDISLDHSFGHPILTVDP